MIRTQVYLTQQEREYLSLHSNETHRSQSELIREAVDYFIEQWKLRKKERRVTLNASKGLWKNRVDLPDMRLLRNEFDRDQR